MSNTVRFNAKGEVTLPFFVVGQEEFDLADAVATLDKVAQANEDR